MEKQTTSQRLKKIMADKGLKQIDILRKCEPYCKKYGIKLGSNGLSQYVTGKVEPSQKVLTLLAEALDTNEVWLMGFDVPNLPRDEYQLTTNREKNLIKFLNNTKYSEIDKKVKEDKEHKLISYIDFYDILINIYPNKFGLVEKAHKNYEEHINLLEELIKQITTITDQRKDIKINSKINLDELKEQLLSGKKNQLFYSIKKYYSKNDILIEIDKRKLFEIKDKNDIEINDENIRLDIIAEFIENILNNLNK